MLVCVILRLTEAVQRSCDECRRRKIRCEAATTRVWPCTHCHKSGAECTRPLGFEVPVAGPSTSAGQYNQEADDNYTLDSSPYAESVIDGQYTMAAPPFQPQMMTPVHAQQTFSPQEGLGSISTSSTSQPLGSTFIQPRPVMQAVNMPAQSSYRMSIPSSTTPMQVLTRPFRYQQAFTQQPPRESLVYSESWQQQPLAIQSSGRIVAQELNSAISNTTRIITQELDSATTNNTVPYASSSPTDTPSSEEPSPQLADYDTKALQAKFGDLAISSDDAKASWFEKPQASEEVPQVQEIEVQIAEVIGLDKTLRIPPELMPSNDETAGHVEYYLKFVHPYMPILNTAELLRQWYSDKTKISPLLLEGLFACVGYLSGDERMGETWLALGERHRKHFEDAPRLSTMQAHLLLLKANEFKAKTVPYRSWSLVNRIVHMGLDLRLEDHLDDHKNGKCDPEKETECILKTRLWSVLFTLELMLGGAQGRTKFNVSVDSVDVEDDLIFESLHESERAVAENFSYMTRSIRTVRTTNRIWGSLSKKTDQWARDPSFVENNKNVDEWLESLPPHLQIEFPKDGSPPAIKDHFLPNLHCYHYLSALLQHRGQLDVLSHTDPKWAGEVSICHEAAKRLCALQEAIRGRYGIPGLYYMLRGAHFHMYCLMTCNMIHIIALHYLSPGMFSQARDFMERHMRLLDEVTKVNPLMPLRPRVEPLLRAIGKWDPEHGFQLQERFPECRPSEDPDSPPETQVTASLSDAMDSDDMATTISSDQTIPMPPETGYDYFPTTTSAYTFVETPSTNANMGYNTTRFHRYEYEPQPIMTAMANIQSGWSDRTLPPGITDPYFAHDFSSGYGSETSFAMPAANLQLQHVNQVQSAGQPGRTYAEAMSNTMCVTAQTAQATQAAQPVRPQMIQRGTTMHGAHGVGQAPPPTTEQWSGMFSGVLRKKRKLDDAGGVGGVGGGRGGGGGAGEARGPGAGPGPGSAPKQIHFKRAG